MSSRGAQGTVLLGLLIGCGSSNVPSPDARRDTAADGRADAGAEALSPAPDGGGTETASVVLPACTLPAAYAGVDAAPGACQAGRSYLMCEGSNNQGYKICISNDPTSCPGPNVNPGVIYTCHHACAPNEYGLACGGPGRSAGGELPAGCHDRGITPGGVIFYCCPCG
jgi:hypothetical protein